MNQFSEYALDRMLRSLWRDGALQVVMPSGNTYNYGTLIGDPFIVRLHRAATVRHLALNPEMALGESYMNGQLTIDGDDLHGFLALVVRNVQRGAQQRVWWERPLL